MSVCPPLLPQVSTEGGNDGSVPLRSDRIRQLTKEWLKSGQDSIPGELENLLQNIGDLQVMEDGFVGEVPFVNRKHLRVERSILKRYKLGTLALHLHFQK